MKRVEGAAHVETASDPGTVPEASPAEAQTAVTPSEGPASPAQVGYVLSCQHVAVTGGPQQVSQCGDIMFNATGAQVAAFVKHPALIVTRNIEWYVSKACSQHSQVSALVCVDSQNCAMRCSATCTCLKQDGS